MIPKKLISERPKNFRNMPLLRTEIQHHAWPKPLFALFPNCAWLISLSLDPCRRIGFRHSYMVQKKLVHNSIVDNERFDTLWFRFNCRSSYNGLGKLSTQYLVTLVPLHSSLVIIRCLTEFLDHLEATFVAIPSKLHLFVEILRWYLSIYHWLF
jgi:hypothetical protein